MKLVIVSPFQFRLHRGIERFSYSIAEQFAQRGVSVTLYTWSSAGTEVRWGDWHPNIKLRQVPYMRYFQSFIASWFYRYWLINDNPDIILLNFLYHGEQVLPASKKYLYVLNTPASQTPERYHFIRDRISHFKFMEFVAVSEMVKREAIPFLKGNKITIIYNGVDTTLFKPRPTSAIARSEGIKIITAAALEERKGIQHLIRILGSISSEKRNRIKYDIYGDGPYKNELEILIMKFDLSDTVKILPAVDNLHEILPSYDLFCLMSRGEAMPLAPLEALACGLPLLTTNYPPFDEFVTPDIGLAINPENHQEILQFILDCKGKYVNNNQTAAARQKSMQFSWDRVANNYMDIVNALYTGTQANLLPPVQG